MDPNACFALFVAAIAEERWDDARNAASDYNAWRDRGGFMAKDREGRDVYRITNARTGQYMDNEEMTRWA